MKSEAEEGGEEFECVDVEEAVEGYGRSTGRTMG